MPRPKLFPKEGKPFPEWQLPKAELQRRVREATREARRFGKTLRLRPLPRIPRKELLLVPETLPSSYYVRPWRFYCRTVCPPRFRVRKNQKYLTGIEWARFIHAIEALAEPGIPAPRYQDFVEIHRLSMETHAGMMWGAHTMGSHDGRNFLTWHREYLAKLEAALMMVNPLVTIPYWDWVNERAIPPPLTNTADLADWGVTRGSFSSGSLPTAQVINSVLAKTTFTSFSSALEGPHGWVHGAVGGTMGTSTSPKDPLFWLHHAFIDKLWADWQMAHPGADPPNPSETLQPAPIMTRTVSQVLSTQALGYVYGGTRPDRLVVLAARASSRGRSTAGSRRSRARR
jgi:tyrosinase